MKHFFLNEKIILGAIIINAIFIFAISFPSLTDHPWLIFIDDLFILFFLLEAIIKIKNFGPKKYFGDAWNRFDFFLVMVSLPAILAYVLPIPSISFLLVFRLLRLIRIVKFMHFIPNMHHLMVGLGRAFRSSIFVLLALFFLNFILAILTCHLFGKAAPEYFGNPMISSYTIFQMFTVEGWNEIPPKVSEYYDNEIYGAFIRFYFVLVVLLGGIFGMSLANAVFVDEMTIDNNQVLEGKIDQLSKQIDTLEEIIRNNN